MKKYFQIAIILFVTAFSSYTMTNAQTSTLESIFMQVNDESCTTDECDVVVRQYTGVYVGWKLSIRCFDSEGWSSWSVWEGSGVYSGSVCGG